MPARKFFNTSGQRYKELNLKEKVAKASDGELIALLATEGKLVKRPLLVGPDFVLVGFREEQWRKNCSGAKRQQSTAAPKAVRPSSRSLPTLSALQNKIPPKLSLQERRNYAAMDTGTRRASLHRTGGPEHCPDNAREGMPKVYI